MHPDPRRLYQYAKTQKAAMAPLMAEVRRKGGVNAIHELRLATRRTRALLWVLRHGSPPLRFKVLERDLRGLGRGLGAVRELDVAIKGAQVYALDPAALKVRRGKALREAQKLLNGKRRRRLSRQITEVIDRLVAQRALSADPVVALLHDRIAPWGGAPLPRAEVLHRLRIAVKKNRYALEALGRPVGKLKKLQDVLGKAHDLEMLQGFLGSNALIKKDLSRLNAQVDVLIG